MGKIIKKGEKGAASNYISRNQAIKKLQLTLSNFRRICILKGIYPHEPRNKKKVGKGSTAPRTYYYKKDIQFLLHEPILDKFREIKIHTRKLHKAIVKREWSVAKQLQENRPEYRLDHIIRERYPTFGEALADLNDALSMVFLFASLRADEHIRPSRVANCQRLASEFQHYVIASGSLRKVFVSIKGFYYQADIRGQEITWVVPHSFTQDVPPDVDLKIMSTFLELYEALLGFVTFKLYQDLNLLYPPKIDGERDKEAAGLAAYVIESADGKELLDALASKGAASGEQGAPVAGNKKAVQGRLKSLSQKLAAIADGSKESNAEAADDDADGTDARPAESGESVDLGIPKAVEAPQDPSEILPTIIEDGSDTDDVPADASALDALDPTSAPHRDTTHPSKLFKDLVFFLSREVPRNSLEFVIRSMGGRVGWELSSGGGSPIAEDDPSITHHIVDRVAATEGVFGSDKRERLQPQWVFDCVNAGRLVRTKGYHPGETLPPHLSPFGGSREGYVPPEASGEVAAETGTKEAGEEEEEEDELEAGEG
ncbi:mRNA-binding ribosome synthesis protein nop7, partial [Irineochytrium annulatum]